MDFTIFNEAEIHTIYDMMVENMNDAQKQVFIGQYGSKEAAIESVKEAKQSVEMTKYQDRIGAVQAEYMGRAIEVYYEVV